MRDRPVPERALAGWVAFAGTVALGAYLNLGLRYQPYDALSRVAQASYVLFSRNPHLAAIGFIWNPLPSLLEIPLVALKAVWPALVTHGMAGVILSSAFSAACVYFLVDILASFGLAMGWRLALCAIYCLNPLILLYSGNGMSEVMLIACMLGSLSGVLHYLRRPSSLRPLTAAAIWLALGFGVRYEAAAFAVLVGVGLMAGLLVQRVGWRRIEGSVLIWLTPFTYAVGLWLYFNWLIMKNPLYFAVSDYSNAGQTASGAYTSGYAPLRAAVHHIGGAIAYVGHFTLLYWPVIIGVIGLVVVMCRDRSDGRAPALLAATVAVPILQIPLLFFGRSAGWDRFFIYYIPTGVIVLAFLASRVTGSGRRRAVALALCAGLLGSGDVGTLVALRTPFLGHVDGAAVTQILAARPFTDYTEFKAVDAYAAAHPKLTILVDTFDAGPIVVKAANPRQFVIDSDLDYQSVLFNPRGRVDALLVPGSSGNAMGKLDAVNRAWPGLWSGRVPWAHLLKAFPGPDHYRLYAVGPGAP